MSLNTIVANKQFTLGDPEAAVSFRGASKYVLIESDIQKLDNGFADYSEMKDYDNSAPTPAQTAFVVECGRLLLHLELRGLRQVLCDYCDGLSPPATGFKVSGNSTCACLSKIAKALEELTDSDEEEDDLATKEQSLRDVLDGLSGRMRVLDDGWLMAQTSAAEATTRKTKLIKAGKKPASSSRGSIIAALLKSRAAQEASL